ncbi:ribonuclease T2 [Pseudorhizobium tarimense]|uniref:Ribonuclease T2 n=2 Tax=Pseudorhizobium tarimense TaxID=1079109 RepID=A0ABV2H6Q4_9HYPH
MTDQPFRAVFAALLLAAVMFSPAAAQAPDFDFYVLSLSWSPTYCASEEGRRSRQQCGGGADHSFVVHGLWPQHERGYPQFCPSREPQRVPQALGETMFDIMPSMGLIGHEWRKHGSCSGLSQRDYLAKTREAFEQVRIPRALANGERSLSLSTDKIEEMFVSANPGMTRQGIAASCDGRRLEEVRICLTRDLQFRDCAEVDRGGCRLERVELPPVN